MSLLLFVIGNRLNSSFIIGYKIDIVKNGRNGIFDSFFLRGIKLSIKMKTNKHLFTQNIYFSISFLKIAIER